MASFEDYEREYHAHLARVRSFLAGTRNRTTLTECDRLLTEAKLCAVAASKIAPPMRTREVSQWIERDVTPLAKEVQRTLQAMGRDELFAANAQQDVEMAQHYHSATSMEYGMGNDTTMEALINSSDDLLRESQSILAETEHIGTVTLQQMGRQREQLQNTQDSLQAIQAVATQAKNILQSMSRKAWRSRLCLYIMIGLLVAANVYVLYRIYRKKHV